MTTNKLALEDYKAINEQFTSVQKAVEAGERTHLLTLGSPARGLCLRVTMGNISRHGKWRPWMPDVFFIWKGKRV